MSSVVDVLITNEWPKGVLHGSKQSSEEDANIGKEIIRDIVYKVAPR